MATESKTQHFQLHRRERRPIPPFGDGTNLGRVSQAIGSALDSCRFAPFSDVPLTGDRTYLLKSHQYDSDLEPRFTFEMENVERLTGSVGATLGDLWLSVSARARHIKRYLPMKEWKLDSVPDTWCPSSEELLRLQSHSDISFILAIRVDTDDIALKKNGLERGKVLSRREFVVKRPTDPSFPIQWVDFDNDTDYPNEMLWVVRWKDLEDRNFSLPVGETLEVWVNKRADQPLQKIAAVPQGRNLGWKMLASEITVEIWYEVLTKIGDVPSEGDSESLAGQVFAKLAYVSGRSYLEIGDIVKDDEEGRTELRRFVSQILQVVT